MNYETENVEFKSRFTDDLYKEVIAFANTAGGIIYVGIDNDGNAIGLTNVDKEYASITNGIRDAIMPDVTMFVQFTVQENRVVRITVHEGTNKPYYLKGKGLKPSGVYVRQGTSSAPASPDLIRQMIKQSDGDQFEEMRSMEQSLTFQAAEKAFQKYGVEFNPTKFLTLGITQKGNALFTNLAQILSDQCVHSVKVAVFADESNTVFKDAQEFSGSIFEQLEDAYKYLRLCNRTHASISGLERKEKPDYPDEALREALLNAMIHRDYSFSGSIIINVNDKKIEFISIGGLLPGLSAEDICSGISQPRNRNLAEVFHRLRLVESYGTGIRRIFSLYARCAMKPRIEVTPNTFKMILPNMNANAVIAATGTSVTTKSMQRIMDYISANGKITDAEICELLGLKKTRAFNIVKQMREMELLTVNGRGANKFYTAT